MPNTRPEPKTPKPPKPPWIERPPRTPTPGSPNAIDDLKTRLAKTKAFLWEHPREEQATAAHIYNIHPTTLNSLLKRKSTGKQHGGQNKILKEYHKSVIHAFILQCLANWLLPTAQLIYSVICGVKRSVDRSFKPPSLTWFSKWWKASGLYKIKAKPLARVRISAQDKKDIHRWFKGYRRTLNKYNIYKKNIINFDKSGFRVGCPWGSFILVPEFIKKVSSCFYYVLYS